MTSIIQGNHGGTTSRRLVQTQTNRLFPNSLAKAVLAIQNAQNIAIEIDLDPSPGMEYASLQPVDIARCA